MFIGDKKLFVLVAHKQKFLCQKMYELLGFLPTRIKSCVY